MNTASLPHVPSTRDTELWSRVWNRATQSLDEDNDDDYVACINELVDILNDIQTNLEFSKTLNLGSEYWMQILNEVSTNERLKDSWRVTLAQTYKQALDTHSRTKNRKSTPRRYVQNDFYDPDQDDFESKDDETDRPIPNIDPSIEVNMSIISTLALMQEKLTALATHTTPARPKHEWCKCPNPCDLYQWSDFLTSFDEDLIEFDVSVTYQLSNFRRALHPESLERTLMNDIIMQRHHNITLEELQLEITKFKLGGHVEQHLRQKLQRLKQKNRTVSEYSHDFIRLKNLCQRFSSMIPTTSDFLYGLNDDLYEKLIVNVDETSELKHAIYNATRLEGLLRVRRRNKTSNNDRKPRTRQDQRETSTNAQQSRHNESKKVYCVYHRNNSHSTEECRSIKSLSEKRSKERSSRPPTQGSNAVTMNAVEQKEQKTSTRTICAVARRPSNSQSSRWLLDFGAAKNFSGDRTAFIELQ